MDIVDEVDTVAPGRAPGDHNNLKIMNLKPLTPALSPSEGEREETATVVRQRDCVTLTWFEYFTRKPPNSRAVRWPHRPAKVQKKPVILGMTGKIRVLSIGIASGWLGVNGVFTP